MHRQVKLMESKLPWIVYDMEHRKFLEVREQKRIALAGLAERQNEFEVSQKPLRSVICYR